MSTATGVFLLSMTAVPVCYSMNLLSSMSDHRLVFGCACLILAAILFLSYLVIAFTTSKHNRPKDIFFYVFSLFAFTSVVDLVIGLELDGVINNFVAFYLKEGEPYLNTAYGTMINYWDGTGHYCMYLMMVTAIVWNQGYRDVGLYWAGSVMNSIIVFLPGNIAGKFGANIKASYLLNMPYIIFPLLGAYRFLNSRKPVELPNEEVKVAHMKGILKRPFDLVMVIYLVLSCVFSLVRVLAALESPIPFAQAYVKLYEPYLLDPVIYPKLQMLVYWFYFTPYRLCAIYGLLYPGCDWMSDWALIHAGAAMQGQFSHIGSSLHSRTPYVLRVPVNARQTFWIINLILLVFPQLLAWRCLNKPAFFVNTTQPKPVKYTKTS